jgi:Mg/Co/Ni transporter MgtE
MGLPFEGKEAGELTIGQAVRTDFPKAGLKDPAGEVLNRVLDSGLETAIVVNAHEVVLGRLLLSRLKNAGDVPVEQVMNPGPSTFRPNVTAHKMLHIMSERGMTTAPVTKSDGVLVGLVVRQDLEEQMG